LRFRSHFPRAGVPVREGGHVETNEPERIPPSAGGPELGSVEVEVHATGVVIVTLRGEHDLNTKPHLSDALARAGDSADVLVDLSECSFIDSTVIGVLVLAYQMQNERGGRLELTIPPGATTIRRVAKIAGLTTFLSIHETTSAGLASLQSES
jgi:anti-sigma B factor antagonist